MQLRNLTENERGGMRYDQVTARQKIEIVHVEVPASCRKNLERIKDMILLNRCTLFESD